MTSVAASKKTAKNLLWRAITWINPTVWLSAVVLAAALLLTYQLVRLDRHTAAQELRAEFNARVREAIIRIDQRMLAYRQVLSGVHGLFFASRQVDRNEFHRYFSMLNLHENYPGIQGVGFSLLIPAADKQAHIEAVRREGYPDYSIKPEGEREIYSSIVYLEPFSGRNLRAFGYDMYSESVRRTAMEQARDSGEAAISGKVTLVQETEQNAQAGFLMYLPLYRSGRNPSSIAERRTSIEGWVYAPFRMDDFMQGLLAERSGDLDIEIHDGDSVSSQAPIYDANKSVGQARSMFKTRRSVTLPARRWTATFRSLPAFEARLNTRHSKWIGAAGIGASIFLTLLVYLPLRARGGAIQAAQKLSESEANLNAILDNSPYIAWLKNQQGRYVAVNRPFLEQAGVGSTGQVLGQSDFDLWDAEIAAKLRAEDEEVMTTRSQRLVEEQVFDGEAARWVETYHAPILDKRNQLLGTTGFKRDITELKRVQLHEAWRSHVLEMLACGNALPELLKAIAEGLESENPSLFCGILVLEEGKRFRCLAAPRLPEFCNPDRDGLGGDLELCGKAGSAAGPTLIEDIQAHACSADFKRLASLAGLRSCCAYPVLKGQDVLALLVVFRKQPKLPSRQDLETIEKAMKLVGIAIERTRIEDELNLAAMVYQNSVEAVMIVDGDNRIIAVNPAFTQITGYQAAEVIGESPKILSSGRHNSTFYASMWDILKRTGRWQGEIWNRRKNGEEYAQWQTINTIFNADGSAHRRVTLFSDITAKKISDELIWKQANFDPLTLLPNRRMFRDRLEQEIRQAQRSGFAFAVLFIDLDRFKEVNDALGHDAGDQLLIDAARRIRDSVRDSDTVARLGGDEFTVILSNLAMTLSVEVIAQNLIDRLAEPFVLGADLVHVSASIGITFYPSDSMEVEELLKNADQAMYHAKNEGRNRFSFYAPSMQAMSDNRMRLFNDLHGALAKNQFLLHFQPIIDLSTRKIVKAEALLRWQHPQRGMIPPAEFIPLAEETGLIIPIGDWVLQESLRWAQRWVPLGPEGFQISVNKSPAQFKDRHFHAWFDQLLSMSLPHQTIVLEITENLLFNPDQRVIDKLLKFRDVGIQIALDDFGTGYSALSYLNQFDIDYLKIDRSFVSGLSTDPHDMALSEAIIMMAHKLGLKVIAEGVETDVQRRLLSEAGCDYGQGFFFSQPIPPEQFETLLLHG